MVGRSGEVANTDVCLAKPDLALRDRTGGTFTFMFYVYVLKSKLNGDIYVGFTKDLRNRLKLHNSKRVKSTKGYVSWILIYYEAYASKSDAIRREKELKLHAAKEKLFEQIKFSIGTVAKR